MLPVRSKKPSLAGRPIREFLLLSCALLAFGSPLPAQVYHVHKYTESEGLSSSQVRGMVQSADGQMWFATRNGIDSFDGRAWQHYGLSDGLGRMNQGVLAIDDEQRIWAVSSGNAKKFRVSIFENGRWQKLPEQLEVKTATTLLPLGGQSREALVGHGGGLVHVQDGSYRKLEFEGGVPNPVFLAKLADYGTAALDLTDDELAHDLTNA